MESNYNSKDKPIVEEFTDILTEEVVLDSIDSNDTSNSANSKDLIDTSNSANSKDLIDATNSANPKDLDNKLEKEDLNGDKLFLDIKNTKQWLLYLDWNIHEQLIQILNDFIKVLLIDNKIICDNEKELIKKNENLIKILTKLPLKQIKSNQVKPTKLAGKLVMNLDNVFRYEIIDQLIKNECVGIKYQNKIDNKDKKILIKENKNLVFKLMDLPVEFINIDDYNFELEEDENESNLKENIDYLKEQFIEIKKQLQDGNRSKDKKNRLIAIKNDMKKMMNYFKNSIEYKMNFFINNAEQFFDEHDTFYQTFTYLDYEYKIYLKSKLDQNNGLKYLDYYLIIDNKDENNSNWQFKTSYDLILKSNLTDKPDKIVKFKNIFSKSHQSFGKSKFISFNELFDKNNGFVKENRIYLEVIVKGSKLN